MINELKSIIDNDSHSGSAVFLADTGMT